MTDFDTLPPVCTLGLWWLGCWRPRPPALPLAPDCEEGADADSMIAPHRVGNFDGVCAGSRPRTPRCEGTS